MAIPVLLQDVVNAMDLEGEGWKSYINQKTGEIVSVSDEESEMVEEGDEDIDVPDWEVEQLTKAREALDSEDFLCLPDKFEIHEWGIMEQFAMAQAAPAKREALLEAIHGSGAFRFFKSTIRRLGIEDDWYRFRDDSSERIARDWLEENKIPYTTKKSDGTSAQLRLHKPRPNHEGED